MLKFESFDVSIFFDQVGASGRERISHRNDGHVDNRASLVGFHLGQPLDAVAGLDDELAAALLFERRIDQFLECVLGKAVDGNGERLFLSRCGVGADEQERA